VGWAPRGALEVTGLNSFLKKLEDGAGYPRAWRWALHQVSRRVKARVRQKAPPGRMQRGVFYYLHRARVPLWSIVSDKAARKGYRYPFALNAGRGKRRKSSGREYQFHWRSGGGSTKGWFSDVQNEMQPWINQALTQAAKQIEAAWRQ
jgi:hypothetical protein